MSAEDVVKNYLSKMKKEEKPKPLALVAEENQIEQSLDEKIKSKLEKEEANSTIVLIPTNNETVQNLTQEPIKKSEAMPSPVAEKQVEDLLRDPSVAELQKSLA